MNTYERAILALLSCGGDASPLIYEEKHCTVLKLRGRYTDYGFQKYILIDILSRDVLSTRQSMGALCPKPGSAEWVPESR